MNRPGSIALFRQVSALGGSIDQTVAAAGFRALYLKVFATLVGATVVVYDVDPVGSFPIFTRALTVANETMGIVFGEGAFEQYGPGISVVHFPVVPRRIRLLTSAFAGNFYSAAIDGYL